MTRHLDFRNDPAVREALLSWWRGLDANRGDRAALRRCADPDAVVMVPAFHRLLGAMRALEHDVHPDALACIAGLSAHVKEHVGGVRLGRQMSEKHHDRARVSDLRFRRMLSFTDRSDIFTALRRTIHLLDGRVDLLELAQSAYWWNDRTRKEWAYDYFGNTVA